MARNELKDALYQEQEEAALAQGLMEQFAIPAHRAFQIAHLIFHHGVPEKGPALNQAIHIEYGRLESLHRSMPHQTHGH